MRKSEGGENAFTAVDVFTEKALCEWAHTVQTRVVEGPTVYLKQYIYNELCSIFCFLVQRVANLLERRFAHFWKV